MSTQRQQSHSSTLHRWTLRERIFLRLARILRSIARPGPLTRPLLGAWLRQLKSRPVQQLRFGSEVAVTHSNFLPERNLLLFLRLDSSDMDVYAEVFTNEEYGPFFDYVEQYQDFPSVRRIVDAGSNIGLVAVLMAARFPEAHILCVEPEPGNLTRLRMHLRLNKLKRRCAVFPCALWGSEAEDLEFDHQFRDGKDWSTRVIPGRGNIRGITLPMLMEQNGWEQIDLLKIDIEGSEKWLLEDPSVAASFLPETRFIVVEVHPETTELARVEQTLRQFHFQIRRDKELIYGRNTRIT